jgi:hypothetical protein
MRLLTLPLTLPFKILRGALSLLQGPEEPAPTPTVTPPRPRYRPASRQPAGNGGAPPAAGPTEPVHVSEQPDLVAEVAEVGAEEGAGAEVHVDEPWPGYGRMRAPEIRTRLRAEGVETAAAVRLYEAAHKGRTSVLEAAGRRVSERPSG